MSSCGWLRHRPSGMDLRSERSDITGAMGPSTSWDPWPRSVARAAVGTQKCTQIGENGLSAQPGSHAECAFPWRRPSRMRFSVRGRAQNALFRRVRFSSPAQTSAYLTQRRILRRRPHVKAQSAPATSRKGALRATARMQSASLGEAHTQSALFRGVAGAECAFP